MLTFDELQELKDPIEKVDDLITAAKFSERQLWLKQPHTKEFLEWVENEINKIHTSTVESCELLSESLLKLELVKEKQLTEVLKYAKQNTP